MTQAENRETARERSTEQGMAPCQSSKNYPQLTTGGVAVFAVAATEKDQLAGS